LVELREEFWLLRHHLRYIFPSRVRKYYIQLELSRNVFKARQLRITSFPQFRHLQLPCVRSSQIFSSNPREIGVQSHIPDYYMLSQQVAMDYLLSSPDHSLDPWMLLPYDASPPFALDFLQTASGLENQLKLNALPNQENFENQSPHVASIEVNSDGTREISNSICLCSQNSESICFSDYISVLSSSIPHPTSTSEHENPLGDHSVLCSNDASFI
jgi:hypothetical protein